MHAWPSVFIPEVRHMPLPQLCLYDSYRRQILPVPDDDPFTMYVCGITPYDATHLGHAATYLTFDLIHRFLRMEGRQVRFIENVTDIDDPLFERATRDSVDWRTLGESQIELFKSDMTNLRILPPEELITVTETIQETIQLIENLRSRNLTYLLDGDLYLDASNVTDFSDLPWGREKSLEIFAERGGDPHRPGKKNQLDPLLWKRSAPDEPSWRTPFGDGRPGWHVECNVISAHLNDGNTISLQGGGADLIFPHHYMTSVQAKAAYDCDFAKIFVHSGMIGFEGEKMSKSRGNLVFVSRLLDEGVEPMTVRIGLLLGRYRNDREWSNELLETGETIYQRLREVLSRQEIPDYADLMVQIVRHLADDLDTSSAFNAITTYLDQIDSNPAPSRSPGALSRFLDALLGIAL